MKEDEKFEQNKSLDHEKQKAAALPYPKSVFFIIGNEFCERFSYYGMKAILSIYMKSKLYFSEDTATVIYHTFSLFCYFTPIFGAMIADIFWGKYKTIVWISMIYVLGHALKTFAAVPGIGIPPVEFSMLGLALIALGTGGIKPCVSAFGGDQFKLPQQERQLQTFFSIFYFAINFGSLISTLLTPVLRHDVGCFGDSTCYSLAFGIPALLMLIATIIFVAGRSLYKHRPLQGNVLIEVIGCIFLAIKNKFKNEDEPGSVPAHWIDRANTKYDKNLIKDVKSLLHVLPMYLPIPVFWALFDQQGSRWTFQATRMSGVIGSSYTIKPDQMQFLNPALILALIPIFEYGVYPAFAKINFLVKPLQRITVGGCLTAFAFFVSGFVELNLMKTYARVPGEMESHLHVMNSLPCNVRFRISGSALNYNRFLDLSSLTNKMVFDLIPGLEHNLEVRMADHQDNTQCHKKSLFIDQFKKSFIPQAAQLSSFIIRWDKSKEVILQELQGKEMAHKAEGDSNKIKVLFDTGLASNQSVSFGNSFKFGDKSADISLHLESNWAANSLAETSYGIIHFGTYEVRVSGLKLGTFSFGQGGVHTLVITGNPVDSGIYAQRATLFTLTEPNSVHMLWLFPQYFLITAGEIMFSITGLEFSYSQSPSSMKSVMQAAWLLTVAFGNLIVIIVAKAKFFKNQASEFFMFGSLMLLDIFIFAIMAYRYVYVEDRHSEDDDDDENTDNEQIEMKTSKSSISDSS